MKAPPGRQGDPHKNNVIVSSLASSGTLKQVQGADLRGRGDCASAAGGFLLRVPILPGEKGGRTLSGCAGQKRHQTGLPAVEAGGKLQVRGFSGGLGA